MGMSYALLAGLPPVHGLYNNILYPLIYMLLGGQAQVCLGTSAIEAMMSASAVAKIVPIPQATVEDRINASAALALGVGLIMVLMRLFGLGMIASFLADPVLSGFSTGSAVIIGTSQLKHVFGMKPPPSVSTVPQTWWYIVTHFTEINIATVVIALLGIVILILMQWINKRWLAKCPIPAAFLMMAFCIPFSFLLTRYTNFNLNIVGDVPQGFPNFQLSGWNTFTMHFGRVAQQAVCYAFFYFVIHITIAKTIAQQHSVPLDANQEALACGVCSVVGSFFQCFPVATSLSRTSIADTAGARTPFYHIANAGVVALTLTWATSLLYYLPKAVLASVVLVGVYGMFFIRDAVNLFHVSLPDFFLWLICCVVAIFWGAMEGVAVTVLISIFWLLKKNAFPAVVELGRLPHTIIYRDTKRFPMALTVPGCRILRFDASLNFANADRFEQSIHTICSTHKRRRPGPPCDLEPASGTFIGDLDTLIIDASSINDMDVTAVRMLKSVAKELEAHKILLLFANWKGPMRDFLERSEFYTTVKPEHCFLSLHDAVVWTQKVHGSHRDTQQTAPNDDDSEERPVSLGPKKAPLRVGASSDSISDAATQETQAPFDDASQETLLHYLTQDNNPVRFITESANATTRDWPLVTRTHIIDEDK